MGVKSVGVLVGVAAFLEGTGLFGGFVAKTRRVFVCRSCGSAQHRWAGKCPDCGQWDSLEESVFDPGAASDGHLGLAAAAGAIAEGGNSPDVLSAGVQARTLAEIGLGDSAVVRIPCGIGEFDRVLGGGLVSASAVLVGGEPGIGKSTLLLQAAVKWAASGKRVLYVSSEESAEQVKMRAERLGGKAAADSGLFVMADTNLPRIVEQARRVKPAVLLIDSIQMIYKPDVPSGPGSITQLRRCCGDLVYLAKLSGIAIVLVGHVTKDGVLAGPRVLEHMVDAVVYFEGDRYHSYRVVRAIKNRFGTTLEIGLFEMTGAGLKETPEGAGVAMVVGSDAPRPGSVVCPVLTGTRCVLIEMQALTATGFPGVAKRKSSGLDSNRLAMLIAVLEQHAGLRLADRDVFASSVGGLKVAEPAADPAILLAIAGAHYRRSLAPATAVVGEVGLGGEIRSVPQLEQRVREAGRLGFKRVLVPKLIGKAERPRVPGVEVVEVRNVDGAVAELG